MDDKMLLLRMPGEVHRLLRLIATEEQQRNIDVVCRALHCLVEQEYPQFFSKRKERTGTPRRQAKHS